MATHLVTGYAGTEHVTAADDGTLHAGVVGKGKYVFNSGSNFACEVVNNNLITIRDGDLMNQGRHIKIKANDYEEVIIDNGLAGVKRYDLIAIRYERNADTNIESARTIVIKGTSSESPTDPARERGDIFDGDLVDDFLLYRVRLNGLEIEGVDCLFEPIHTLTDTIQGKLVNQATKTWMIPDDPIEQYICDIGEPDYSKYPTSEYGGGNEYYVDVLTGKAYQVETVLEINGGEYKEWKHVKTLTSVQDELASVQEHLTVKKGTFIHKLTSGTYEFERLEKQGNIVTMSCKISNANIGGHQIWAQLPEGFRPPDDIYLSAFVMFNNNLCQSMVWIDENGDMHQFHSSSPNTTVTQIFVTGSFSIV